jgi:hypothetical protein
VHEKIIPGFYTHESRHSDWDMNYLIWVVIL